MELTNRGARLGNGRVAESSIFDDQRMRYAILIASRARIRREVLSKKLPFSRLPEYRFFFHATDKRAPRISGESEIASGVYHLPLLC